MQSPSADSPMLGRAATITRLPGWNPDVSRSRSRNPRRSGDIRAGLVESRDAFEALLQQGLDVAELGRDAALREVEDTCSARSTRICVSPGRSQPSWAISWPAR